MVYAVWAQRRSLRVGSVAHPHAALLRHNKDSHCMPHQRLIWLPVPPPGHTRGSLGAGEPRRHSLWRRGRVASEACVLASLISGFAHARSPFWDGMAYLGIRDLPKQWMAYLSNSTFHFITCKFEGEVHLCTGALSREAGNAISLD